MRDNSEPLLSVPESTADEDRSDSAAPLRNSSTTEAVASEPNPPVPDRATPSNDLENATERRVAVSDTRELKHERKHEPESHRRQPRFAAGFDPLTRILALMERERRVGLSIGLAGALVVHGAGAAHGYASLLDLGAFAAAVRSAVMDDVRATYAVEAIKPPPPPPAPEPEPEKPQQQQTKAPAQPQNQQQEKPPAPAQAAKVLTADPDPSEPLDLTDQGFVSGDGDRFAGGVTSATGTSKTAVRDLNAKPGGVVGGKGTAAAAPPPPPKEDLTRPASPATRDWGDCGFPAEADVEQIDFMRLSVVVTVGTDGRAQSVTILKDPGYGFGNQARQCALRKSYNVGLDANGKPVVTTTPPFIVTFRR